MAAIDFNAEDVEPRSGFDPLPAGKYLAVITASEEKPTRKGDGSYLQLTFEVVDGEHKGRRLWARLNLNNPSDQAVGIARAELSAICRAVGVTKLKDSEQLHDRPLTVKVKQKADKESGEVRNEISGYEPAASATKPAAAPAAKPATAPWQRAK